MPELAFYTDGHIAKAVVNQLQQRGVTIIRCEDVSNKDVDDELHLAYAVKHGHAIVTGDDDFLSMHAGGHEHYGIFYILPALRSRSMTNIGPIVRGRQF